jgi:GTP-binding protein
VAVVGQPNVGKSTLMNKILQENRLVVNELAGTTRDSISLPFTRSGKNYSLIDTAGIRRRAKVDNVIEKFSVVKSLQAIETCNVVILMLDATRGVLDQDLHLLDFIVEQGRALVIVFNKWDIATEENQSSIKKQVNDRLHFVEFAKHHYISALRGTGIAKLFKYIDTAYQCAMQDLPTSKLNLILEDLLKTHQPPLVHGRRIKLRYAHSGGKNPPRIIIHGNQTEQVPTSYKRFLIKGYIKALKLEGTPLKIQFKTGDYPYKDKRNELTDSQKRRRNRVKKIFGWIKKK